MVLTHGSGVLVQHLQAQMQKCQDERPWRNVSPVMVTGKQREKGGAREEHKPFSITGSPTSPVHQTCILLARLAMDS